MGADHGPEELREVLGSVPFFQELIPDEGDRTLPLGRLVSYPKNAVLFREGRSRRGPVDRC